MFFGELGFAADHFDGSLVAGCCARAAAVAFFFVYANNFSKQVFFLPSEIFLSGNLIS
jgi:hypothetical protein